MTESVIIQKTTTFNMSKKIIDTKRLNQIE
jgi:hypothetical protein